MGKPVDRNEWLMSPPTVNAYNEPQKNEIVFPAGILQPPFFNREATDAVNFGSMGMVVGHEITHGFDDEGRKFDADGNLRDWWSATAGKDFVRARRLREEAVRRLRGGRRRAREGRPHPRREHRRPRRPQARARGDATTGTRRRAATTTSKYRFDLSQQFFLGFAQSWCSKVRPEAARMRAHATRTRRPTGGSTGRWRTWSPFAPPGTAPPARRWPARPTAARSGDGSLPFGQMTKPA